MDIDLKDSNLNKGIEIHLNKNSVKKKQKPIKAPLTDDQRKKRKITILLLSITLIILLGIGFLIYKEVNPVQVKTAKMIKTSMADFTPQRCLNFSIKFIHAKVSQIV